MCQLFPGHEVTNDCVYLENKQTSAGPTLWLLQWGQKFSLALQAGGPNCQRGSSRAASNSRPVRRVAIATTPSATLADVRSKMKMRRLWLADGSVRIDHLDVT